MYFMFSHLYLQIIPSAECYFIYFIAVETDLETLGNLYKDKQLGDSRTWIQAQVF